MQKQCHYISGYSTFTFADMICGVRKRCVLFLDPDLRQWHESLPLKTLNYQLLTPPPRPPLRSFLLLIVSFVFLVATKEIICILLDHFIRMPFLSVSGVFCSAFKGLSPTSYPPFDLSTQRSTITISHPNEAPQASDSQ